MKTTLLRKIHGRFRWKFVKSDQEWPSPYEWLIFDRKCNAPMLWENRDSLAWGDGVHEKTPAERMTAAVIGLRYVKAQRRRKWNTKHRRFIEQNFS